MGSCRTILLEGKRVGPPQPRPQGFSLKALGTRLGPLEDRAYPYKTSLSTPLGIYSHGMGQ